MSKLKLNKLQMTVGERTRHGLKELKPDSLVLGNRTVRAGHLAFGFSLGDDFPHHSFYTYYQLFSGMKKIETTENITFRGSLCIGNSNRQRTSSNSSQGYG
jgi:hypothetical protein